MENPRRDQEYRFLEMARVICNNLTSNCLVEETIWNKIVPRHGMSFSHSASLQDSLRIDIHFKPNAGSAGTGPSFPQPGLERHVKDTAGRRLDQDLVPEFTV